MASRQFAHLQQKSLDTLRERVPPGCPLVIGRADPSGFVITWRDDDSQAPIVTGRYQVIHAWIDGFVRGWINAPGGADRSLVLAALQQATDTLQQLHVALDQLLKGLQP